MDFNLPIGWGELVKRTATETRDDNGLGLAAQLAYYFFLALFPALLVLVSLAGLISDGPLFVRILGQLDGVAPRAVVDIIREQLAALSQHSGGGILTFGAAAALWSSSAAMVGLIDALNRAYDVEDARPWWKQRLLAIALTFGVAAFALAATALVVSGPELGSWAAGLLGLGPVFEWTWTLLRWPLGLLLIATAFALVYYFAPDVDQDLVWLTPGSVLATVLWLLGSLAFRYYVVNFGSYNATYGPIGGVMVLMLWLYLSGLVVIIGAELNSEIEHASPHGKDAGEKTPGQRKRVGPRAAREREASQPRHIDADNWQSVAPR